MAHNWKHDLARSCFIQNIILVPLLTRLVQHMAAPKAKLSLKLNRKLSRLDIFVAVEKFKRCFRSHFSLPIKHWDCVHRLPFYFVANILLLILFSGTLFYVVHIFDTHLITFSNDFHVACHRVSLDDCKKNLPTSPPPRLCCPPQVRKYCPLVPEGYHYCSTTPPGG